MVHLIFHLDHHGHTIIGQLIKNIQDYVEEHKGFVPHSTYNPEEKVLSQLYRDPRAYQWGEWHKRCHIEYGWSEVPLPIGGKYRARTANFLAGGKTIHLHRGISITSDESKLPGIPGQVKYSLYVRKITDWTEQEQNALEEFICDKLGILCLYKHPDEYTDREFSDFQGSVDWSICQSTAVRKSIEMKQSLWSCRICKGIFSKKVGDEHYDPGHNAGPIYSVPSGWSETETGRRKCCDNCNNMYILIARMGGDPRNTRFPGSPGCANPFIYPKQPTSERYGHQSQGMAMASPITPDEPDVDWESTEEIFSNRCVKNLDEAFLHTRLAQLEEAHSAFREHMNVKRGEMKQKKSKIDFADLWSKIPEDYRMEFLRNTAKEQIGEIVAEKKRQWEVEEQGRLAEEKVEVEAQKAEIRQKAIEARKTLERVKRASAPKNKQIEKLKEEIVKRDERIAELKVVEGVIKSLDGEQRALICSQQIAKKIGRCEVVDDFTDEPRGIPDWALDDFRQASQAKMMAEVKAAAEAKKKAKKKTIPTTPCQYCDKQCRANQLQNVWGDMLCGSCARKAGQ